MLTPDEAEPLVDFDWGVPSVLVGIPHFWREHPLKMGRVFNPGSTLGCVSQPFSFLLRVLLPVMVGEDHRGPWAIKRENTLSVDSTGELRAVRSGKSFRADQPAEAGARGLALETV